MYETTAMEDFVSFLSYLRAFHRDIGLNEQPMTELFDFFKSIWPSLFSTVLQEQPCSLETFMASPCRKNMLSIFKQSRPNSLLKKYNIKAKNATSDQVRSMILRELEYLENNSAVQQRREDHAQKLQAEIFIYLLETGESFLTSAQRALLTAEKSRCSLPEKQVSTAAPLVPTPEIQKKSKRTKENFNEDYNAMQKTFIKHQQQLELFRTFDRLQELEDCIAELLDFPSWHTFMANRQQLDEDVDLPPEELLDQKQQAAIAQLQILPAYFRLF